LQLFTASVVGQDSILASAQVQRDETKPIVLKRDSHETRVFPRRARVTRGIFTCIASASFASRSAAPRTAVHVPSRLSRLALPLSYRPETTSREDPETSGGSRDTLPRALLAESVDSRTASVSANRTGREFNVISAATGIEITYTRVTASAQLNFKPLRLLFILTWRRQVLQVAPPSDRRPPAAYRSCCGERESKLRD